MKTDLLILKEEEVKVEEAIIINQREITIKFMNKNLLLSKKNMSIHLEVAVELVVDLAVEEAQTDKVRNQIDHNRSHKRLF